MLLEGPEVAAPTISAPAAASSRPGYNAAVGYLRAFARLLVFALHSVVAYFAGPFPLDAASMRFSFPVLDPHRFAGARILVAFNEISLMALLFFLSGLFLWPSLSRKGARAFLRERVTRLLLPFLFCGGLVAAIACYPAYLVSRPAAPGIADYFGRWMTPAHWTTGPAWFLLVLFIYDLIAIGAFAVAPDWGRRIASIAAHAKERPLRFYLQVLAVSGAAYAPLAFAFGPYDWFGVGFFWIQKSRVLLYGAWFFFGVAVGAFGLSRGLFARDGALGRQWWRWGLAAIPAFLVAGNLLAHTSRRHLETSPLWGGLADASFVVCCATCAFALMAIFVRFARQSRLIDRFADNSYGMYLVHYGFVTWTQYALISSPLSPILKWLLVLAVTLAGSWTLAASLRKIPVIGRNI